MGLFGSSKNEMKCKKCGTVLPDKERLKKHLLNGKPIKILTKYRKKKLSKIND